MLAGSPVLPGDCFITHQPVGHMQIVFEVLKAEAGSTAAEQDSMDEKIPTIITTTTFDRNKKK
jgi:hypothetical protein